MGWLILIIIGVFIIWRILTKRESNTHALIYTSSVTRGGDPTAPHKLIIDDEYLTWKKNRGLDFLWLSVNSVVIPRRKITGVLVKEKVIGSDIVVFSDGLATIYAKNFSGHDAQEIKQLLTP